jgi:HD-like signal output (HDOD) protein
VLEEIAAVVEKLKSLVGGMLLKQWGLEQSFVTAAENAENWHRNESAELDYADLVVIAQLQNNIRAQLQGDLPALEEVPAFKKFNALSNDPECSKKIMQLAHEELQEVMGYLAG